MQIACIPGICPVALYVFMQHTSYNAPSHKWPISDMDWWRDRLAFDRCPCSQRTMSLIANSSLGNMIEYRWLYGRSWGVAIIDYPQIPWLYGLINCTYWMCNSGEFASFLDRGVVFSAIPIFRWKECWLCSTHSNRFTVLKNWSLHRWGVTSLQDTCYIF